MLLLNDCECLILINLNSSRHLKLENALAIPASNNKKFNELFGPTGVAVVTKWNESGFRPPLCTYRLNWARRTSWGWWAEWDDTVLQTQDSKFEPWRSETEHATSRSRSSPQYWLSHVDGEETFFVSFKPPRPGTETRTLAWKAAVLTTALGPPPPVVTSCSEGQGWPLYMFPILIHLEVTFTKGE